MVVGIRTRAPSAALRFAETVATFALMGYPVYRLLLSSSDDPR
ncbi:hypothetical protein [Natronorubrum halophilum]|nr:hypothetical protein [Natronorubrum halophilum]